MDNTLNHTKWIWGMTLLKRFGPGPSRSNHPIKSLWNAWPKNNGGNTTMPQTARSAPNHSSQQIKNSATTIIWRVNIEAQFTMHVTWITTSIQRKWKFHALLTTSKVYYFYVIVIFTIASFLGAHLSGGSRWSRPLPFFDTVQIVPSNS